MHACHLVVKNRAAEIDRATSAARAFAEQTRLDARTRVALNLVVEELVNNTLVHGGAAPESDIEIRLQRVEDGIRVSYTDAGRSFDPTRDLPPADLHLPADERRVGGLGWVLIRAYCHDFDYRREADRNHLRMTLSLAPGAS